MRIAVVVIYLAQVVAIGRWANCRFITGMTDFPLAGRRLGV
jgi:Na+/proline symporter